MLILPQDEKVSRWTTLQKLDRYRRRQRYLTGHDMPGKLWGGVRSCDGYQLRRVEMRRRVCLVLLIVALVVACGGGESKDQTAPTEEASSGGAVGDSARGEELFNQTTIGSLPGCVTCHSLTPDKVLVGPSLAGVASRAGSRVSGESAEEYLHQSIVNANAFVVDGFSEGVMPAGFGDELSDQQLSDLVAYLLTLK